jgi:hypothetical protein
MNSRYNRFLHLERSRGEQPKPQEQVGLQGQGRFESVQGPAEAPQQVEVPEAHLERFRRQAEEPLVLEDRSAEPARVFSRCVRCGAANGRYQRQCYQCGADLESPEQREYDLQQQQAQQEAEAREREAQEARAREQAERQQEQSRLQEELMEQLRAEVGGRVRRGAWYDSLGWRLLQDIRHSRQRMGVLLALILIPLALARSRQPGLSVLGWLLGLGVVALFLPARWWRQLFKLLR